MPTTIEILRLTSKEAGPETMLFGHAMDWLIEDDGTNLIFSSQNIRGVDPRREFVNFESFQARDAECCSSC